MSRPKPRSKNDLLYRPLSEELAYLKESHTFDGNEHLYSAVSQAEKLTTETVESTSPVNVTSLEETTPEVEITGGVEITIPYNSISWDRFAIRRVRLVQDGLTRAQFALYDHLWHKGQGSDDTEYVDASAGWGRLAKELRMSDKSIKLNMLQLVNKRVVELAREEDRYANTPRVYRVWSMRKILERWAAAGMDYIKANSGVQFLTQDEIAHYSGQGRLPKERSPRVISTGGAIPRRHPVVDTSTGPGVISSTPSIVHDHTVVAEELAKHIHIVGTTDDAYIERLITNCRLRAPDAPAEMIAWIISTKIRKAAKDNIQDAAGYLATSVEGMFSGISYDIAKQEWERGAQRAEQRNEFPDSSALQNSPRP